jgi:hypothetical protein
MAFKVNYGLERAERNRAKQAKKEAKAKARKSTDDGGGELGVPDPELDQVPSEGGFAGEQIVAPSTED